MDNQFLVIKASAGTGKTYTLTSRYIDLIKSGVRAEQILVTTFTRKAAFEIKERVFKRLANEAKSNVTSQKTFTKFLNEQHRIQILTFDSFCIYLLKLYQEEIGIGDRWSIASEHDTNRLQKKAFQDYLKEANFSDNLQLIRDLFDISLPSTVIGKLHKIIAEIIKLYRFAENADWQINLDYYQIDKGELPLLIEQLKHFPVPINKSGTVNIHWTNAIKSILNLLQTNDYLKLIDNTLFEAAYNKKSFGKIICPEEFSSIIESIADIVIKELLTSINHKAQAFLKLARSTTISYFKSAILEGKLSYTDIKEILRLKLASSNQIEDIISDIFFRLDSTLQHILLDEFQDTALDEWYVIKPFISQIFEQIEERSFFCVGDTKQAIYGWRGGKSDLLNHLKNIWPAIKENSLDSSYRCSQSILNFCNSLFKNLSACLQGDCDVKEQSLLADLAAWSDQYILHKQALIDSTNTDLPVKIQIINETEDQDPKQMVLQNAAITLNDILSKSPHYDIAILFRTNNSAVEFCSLLDQQFPKLVYDLDGGESLFASSAVRTIISLLKFYLEPYNFQHYYCFATSKFASLYGITDYENEESLVSAYQEIQNSLALNGLCGFLNQKISLIINELNSLDREGVFGLLKLAINDPLITIEQLIEKASLTLLKNSSQSNIKVLTIHKAKGLEFDAVLLPELGFPLIDRKRFPKLFGSSKNPDSDYEQVLFRPPLKLLTYNKQIAEAVRDHERQELFASLSLFYVALTRAKRELYLFFNTPKSKINSPAAITFKLLNCELLKDCELEVY